MFCPDWQFAELSAAYSALYFLDALSSEFESALRGYIAILKHQIFRLAVTPVENCRNVHILNIWKERLKHKLGFCMDYQSEAGIVGDNPFEGHPGNALYAFFSKLTPPFAATKIMEFINKDPKRISDAGLYLVNAKYDAHNLLVFESQEKKDYSIPSAISYDDVLYILYILLSMGLLKCSNG